MKRFIKIIVYILFLLLISSPVVFSAWPDWGNPQNDFSSIHIVGIYGGTWRTRKEGAYRYDYFDPNSRADDYLIYLNKNEISETYNSTFGKIYKNYNILNEKYETVSEVGGSDDMQIFWDTNDKDLIPTDAEAYLMYISDGKKYLGTNDQYALIDWHTVVQKAYLVLKGQYETNDEEVMELVESARDYANYIGEIRQNLGDKNQEDLSLVSEEDLAAAMSKSYGIDYNGEATIIREGDTDYVVISNLESKLNARTKIKRVHKRNKENTGWSRVCSFMERGYVSDIVVQCSSRNGTKTLHYVNGDFELEILDPDKHYELNRSRMTFYHCNACGSTHTKYLSVNGTEVEYPIPYKGEKFNIKIPASSITNGSPNDPNAIISVDSINIVPDLAGEEIGAIAIKYNDLKPVTWTSDMDFDYFFDEDDNEGWVFEDERGRDFVYMIAKNRKYSDIAYENLQNDSVLAMMEKKEDMSSVWVKANDEVEAGAGDSDAPEIFVDWDDDSSKDYSDYGLRIDGILYPIFGVESGQGYIDDNDNIFYYADQGTNNKFSLYVLNVGTTITINDGKDDEIESDDIVYNSNNSDIGFTRLFLDKDFIKTGNATVNFKYEDIVDYTVNIKFDPNSNSETDSEDENYAYIYKCDDIDVNDSKIVSKLASLNTNSTIKMHILSSAAKTSKIQCGSGIKVKEILDDIYDENAGEYKEVTFVFTDATKDSYDITINDRKYKLDTSCKITNTEVDKYTGKVKIYFNNLTGSIKDTDELKNLFNGKYITYDFGTNYITFDTTLMTNTTIEIPEGYFLCGTNKKLPKISLSKVNTSTTVFVEKEYSDAGIKAKLQKNDGSALLEQDLKIADISYENNGIVIKLAPSEINGKITNINNTAGEGYNAYVDSDKYVYIRITEYKPNIVWQSKVKMQYGTATIEPEYKVTITIDEDKYNNYMSKKSEISQTGYASKGVWIKVDEIWTDKFSINEDNISINVTGNENENQLVRIKIPVVQKSSETLNKINKSSRTPVNIDVSAEGNNIILEMNMTDLKADSIGYVEIDLNDKKPALALRLKYVGDKADIYEQNRDYEIDGLNYNVKVSSYNPDFMKLDFSGSNPIAYQDNKLIINLDKRINSYEIVWRDKNAVTIPQSKVSISNNGSKLVLTVSDFLEGGYFEIKAKDGQAPDGYGVTFGVSISRSGSKEDGDYTGIYDIYNFHVQSYNSEYYELQFKDTEKDGENYKLTTNSVKDNGDGTITLTLTNKSDTFNRKILTTPRNTEGLNDAFVKAEYSDSAKELKVTFNKNKLLNTEDQHVYVEFKSNVTNHGTSGTFDEVCGIGFSVNGGEKVTSQDTDGLYAALVKNNTAYAELGLVDNKISYKENYKDNTITFDFIMNKGTLETFKVMNFDGSNSQSSANSENSTNGTPKDQNLDRGVKSISVSGNKVSITYDRNALLWDIDQAGNPDEYKNAHRNWNEFQVKIKEADEPVKIEITIFKMVLTEWKKDVKVENIGKDEEKGDLNTEDEKDKNNGWISISKGGLHDLNNYTTFTGDGSTIEVPTSSQLTPDGQKTTDGVLMDVEFNRSFINLETVNVRKKGYLKSESGSSYVKLQFSDPNAVSWRINYRYDNTSDNAETVSNNEENKKLKIFSGDGYEGSAIAIQNSGEGGIVKGDSAVFNVQRAGESAITVLLKEGNTYYYKIIIVYIPQMYVGEITDSSGKSYAIKPETWHSSEGNITGLPLNGDGNLNAQYEVELNAKTKEVYFYNITGGITLSEYTRGYGFNGGLGKDTLTKDGKTFYSSKYAWDNGEDNNIEVNDKTDSYPTERRISESYSLDVSLHRDIYGFGGDNNSNYEEIPDTAKKYVGKHRLKWSWRDSEVKESVSQGGTLGSTYFSLMFVASQVSTPGGGGGDYGGGNVNIITKTSNYVPTNLSINPDGTPIGVPLTMPIHGKVWLENTDTNKDVVDGINGKYDGTDLSADVKATLYRYDANNGNSKEFVMDLTINNISYTVPDLIPPYSFPRNGHTPDYYYGVEYTYDGQKYESTEFLMTGNESAKSNDSTTENGDTEAKNRVAELLNIRESTSSYIDYADSSFARETSIARNNYDGAFEQIHAESIDGNGNSSSTNGMSVDANGNQIGTGGSTYSETVPTEEDKKNGIYNARAILNNSNTITVATNSYLQYPMKEDREGGYHLKDQKSAVTVVRPNGTNTCYPVHEYCDYINYGVIDRDESDLSVTKDLYKAKVVVNKQALEAKAKRLVDADGEYEFNIYSRSNGENNHLDDIKKNDDIEREGYTLGLYNSDYNYTPEIYKDSKLEDYKKGTQLRIFVTYKVAIRNESIYNTAIVNEITDVHDSSFTLVSSGFNAGDNYSYKDNVLRTDILDNEGVPRSQDIALGSFYRLIPENWTSNETLYNYDSRDFTLKDIKDKGIISWTESGDSMTCKLNDKEIKSNQRLELFMTYEVNISGLQNDKTKDVNNYIEITNYSTKYTRRKNATSAYITGSNSGKVDRDSAAGNNIGRRDLSQYFEDDIGVAPTVHIKLNADVDRVITGNVWDDLDHDGKNNDENGIDNISVSLIEKCKVPIKGKEDEEDEEEKYVEYEFVHKGEQNGGQLSINADNTGSEYVRTLSGGVYRFSGIAAGIYSVRFEYGANMDMIEKSRNGNKSGIEDDDGNCLTYNGQDYKNTIYQGNQGTLNDEFYNTDITASIIKERYSDARDYEPARLRNIAYSRTISNVNGEALGVSKDKLSTEESERKAQLNMLENTYMRADTAKLNIGVLRISSDGTGKEVYEGYDDNTGKYVTNGNVQSTYQSPYTINNIDFGLEKRPETKLVLDKKLTEIILTKNDGKDIVLRAKVNPDNSVSTEEGLEINKIMTVGANYDSNSQYASQGFHYIQMENSYLSGLGIKLKYDIYVTNNSEADYVGIDLANMTRMEDIYTLASNMEQSTEYISGQGIQYGNGDGTDKNDSGNYLGSHYYTHDNTGTLVTTTVDQIVDYIDNDTSLDKNENTGVENHAWVLAEVDPSNPIENLKGMFSDNSYTDNKLKDYRDVNYFDIAKSNIALSTNSNIHTWQTKNIDYEYSGSSSNQYVTYMKSKDARSADLTSTDPYSGLFDIKRGSIDQKQIRYTVDNIDKTKDNNNKTLTIQLTPNSVPEGESTAYIGISMTTNVSSGTDGNNLKFDNLAEILVYSNTVGRKDMYTIPGNANETAKVRNASSTWYAGQSSDLTNEIDENGRITRKLPEDSSGTSVNTERDADSPYYITITPPTGIDEVVEQNKTVLIVTIIAVTTVFIACITVPIVTVMYDRSRRRRMWY